MSEQYRVTAGAINCPGYGEGWFRIERPFNQKRGVYLDSDDAPTLVTAAALAEHIDRHGEGCHLNLTKLLRGGALAEYTPPVVAAAEIVKEIGRKGAKSGEDAG